MLWTQKEALAVVQHCFADCECIVADGDQTHESGVVTSRVGETVASFRLVYRSICNGEQTLEIAEIRIGQPGRFCGNVEEIAEFERCFPNLADAD